jgi:hypothetical protein
MAAHDVLILNETVPQIQEPQVGDTYNFPRAAHFQFNITTDGTIDGRDVAADGVVLDTATQPGDNLSTLVNDILASQAEAEAGTDNTKMMTPLRVAQAISILAAGLKNNPNASVPPIATDDDSEGYSVGSFWIDVVTDNAYRCVDATTNVAVWVKTTLSSSDLATVALSGDSDDLIEGSTQLLLTVSERGKIASAIQDGATDFTFTPTAAPAYARGKCFYDSTEEAMSYYNEVSDVTINMGQEMVLRGENNSGGILLDGTAVFISGSSGTLPRLQKAQPVNGKKQVIGLVTHDIANGSVGYVCTFGVVRGIDTSTFSAGDALYLDATTPGALTNVEPTYTQPTIMIGHVINSDPAGKVFVDVEHAAGATVLTRSYTFASRNAASGEYFQAGFYEAPAAAVALTNASPSATLGSANSPSGAHVCVVASGPGSTDGSDLVLTVTGTSITDLGIRTTGDSEVVVPVATTSSLSDMYETAKKWIGQVTLTLSSTGGTTFSYTFNNALAKYEDFNNTDMKLRAVECVGLCNTGDSGFNIEVYHHNAIGWNYHATAFVPGNTPVLSFTNEYGTESDPVAGEHFAYKHSSLATAISGAAMEGLLIKVTTTVNNSISYMDTHLTVTVE